MKKKKDNREYAPEKQVPNYEDDPVIDAFRDFDKNDVGKITNHEFRYILTHVGENLFTDEEVDALFKDCNLNENDNLDYEEFINFWKTNMKN